MHHNGSPGPDAERRPSLFSTPLDSGSHHSPGPFRERRFPGLPSGLECPHLRKGAGSGAEVKGGPWVQSPPRSGGEAA